MPPSGSGGVVLHKASVLCLSPTYWLGCFHCLLGTVLLSLFSVSPGSKQSQAPWAVLWRMCIPWQKLLIQWDSALPGWNVEGLGLRVLHVWPGPSDLPDGRVCQGGLCPGKKWRHFHLHGGTPPSRWWVCLPSQWLWRECQAEGSHLLGPLSTKVLGWEVNVTNHSD